MVSQRMLQLGTARSVIRELFEYGRQRAAEVGAENVFDFSLGNPSVPAPAAVNETAIRLLREQGDTIHCYTSAPGDTGARQRIADSLNRRFGEHYTADELYLTVGAAASLCCVFNGLTCPGDEYILFAPYFPEYKVFIEGARGKVQVITPEIEQFQIDFTAFEKAVNCRTKGVVINSPNNPSGVVYSRQTLETLAAILRAKEALYGHPIYLISDEPYREIAFDGVEVPWVPSIYQDTIVCYSFSKSLSLPGERIGYLAVNPKAEQAMTIAEVCPQISRTIGCNGTSTLMQLTVGRCADLTSQLDYEVELAVILGRDAKNVPMDQVKDYVLGYTILNDVSARDLQAAHQQWYFGKSLDNFTPMGPWIVTRDEFDWMPKTGIRSYVNGELRQNSSTDLMMTSIEDAVHQLTQGVTLLAGTIIAMGTPSGVGMAFTPPKFMRPGDVVRCEIDGIGALENTVE